MKTVNNTFTHHNKIMDESKLLTYVIQNVSLPSGYALYIDNAEGGQQIVTNNSSVSVPTKFSTLVGDVLYGDNIQLHVGKNAENQGFNLAWDPIDLYNAVVAYHNDNNNPYLSGWPEAPITIELDCFDGEKLYINTTLDMTGDTDTKQIKLYDYDTGRILDYYGAIRDYYFTGIKIYIGYTNGSVQLYGTPKILCDVSTYGSQETLLRGLNKGCVFSKNFSSPQRFIDSGEEMYITFLVVD